ncbi:O-antigen ligase family protein [Erythrobacter insulae]|uniref:O-antigen ligase family protein n=1 Tax=Erythrobacter insulae TaxID=2584124 RepID=A0A547PB90_9SPHN|nr:O-antigen ligase family protein [Erythrobacter insulae]TRD11412.1 O-antigen ligase family protein [Erythrobacter insulae]
MILRGFFYYLVTWSLAGYFLLAAVTHVLGLDNSTISLIFRAIGGVFAGVLIAFAARRRFDLNLLLIIIFGVAYSTQLALTLHVRGEPSALQPFAYWAWALGGCIFPAIATYLCFTADKQLWTVRLVLGVAVASTCFMLVFGSSMSFASGGLGVDTGRWNIPSVNPIAMGHLGATTILVALGWLLGRSRITIKQMGIAGAAAMAGGLLLLLANSRGPLLALAVCLFILALARFNRRGTAVLLVVALSGAAVLMATQYDLIVEGVLKRFSLISSGQDRATELRFIAFNGAWDQFAGSPLMGDGIEERNTGFYPHNVILEALMATGLVGAIPFVLLLARAVLASWEIVRQNEQLIWLALLQIQYLIAAQLSGSIYQSTALWVTTAAVLAATSKAAVRPASTKRRRLSPSSRPRPPIRRPTAPHA